MVSWCIPPGMSFPTTCQSGGGHSHDALQWIIYFLKVKFPPGFLNLWAESKIPICCSCPRSNTILSRLPLIEQHQNSLTQGNILGKTPPLKKKHTATFPTFSCLTRENMEEDDKESKEMEANVGGVRGAESRSEIQHIFPLIHWEWDRVLK